MRASQPQSRLLFLLLKRTKGSLGSELPSLQPSLRPGPDSGTATPTQQHRIQHSSTKPLPQPSCLGPSRTGSHHGVLSQAVPSQAARPQPYSPGRVDVERLLPAWSLPSGSATIVHSYSPGRVDLGRVHSQAALQAARPQPYSPQRVDLERVHPRCPALGAGRLVDEPLTIPDPEAEKPENWDDEKTIDSIAPTVPNQILNHQVG